MSAAGTAPPPSGLPHVFLSYNSAEGDIVRTLASLLRARSLEIWLAEWKLKPGDLWQQKLEEAIEGMAVAVVCIGAGGLGAWQEHEIRAVLSTAVKQGIRVVPLLLPGAETSAVSPYLEQFMWSDCRDGLTIENINRLEAGLRQVTVVEERPYPVAISSNSYGDIFISYAKQDEEVAKYVHQSLLDAGFSPTLGMKHVQAGANWVAEMNNALEVASYLVVLITPASMASRWIQQQWTAFMTKLDEAGTLLIPIIIQQATLPLLLRTLQVIDATVDLERGVDALVTMLKREHSSPWPAEHRPVSLGDRLLSDATRRELRLVTMRVLKHTELRHLLNEVRLSPAFPNNAPLHRRVQLMLDLAEQRGRIDDLMAWLEEEDYEGVLGHLDALRDT